MALRRVAEIMCRRIVLQRRLPAPCSSIRMFVSPGVRLRFWRRDLNAVDPELFALAQEFVTRNSVVWDIGASLGLFSFAAACATGPQGGVLAVEPDAWVARLLAQSAEVLPDSAGRVEIVQQAVNDRAGPVRLAIPRRGRAATHLIGFGTTQTGGARKEVEVVATTLDQLAENHPLPDVIKIDVEGAEAAVLRGGEDLLVAQHPVLLVEVSAYNAEEIGLILRRHGYVTYDASMPPDQRTPLDVPVWSTVAIAR